MENSGGGIIGVLSSLILLGLIILVIAGTWKVFQKAGKPGWGCLIPFYNIVLMLDIAGKPAWWLFLFFIPLANIYAAIVMSLNIAKAFGKGTGFGLGLVFLGGIFYPILGFGDAQYRGV